MKISTKKQAGLLFVSDMNYENMIADLYYNDRHFVTIWSKNNIFFINTPLSIANQQTITHTIPLKILVSYLLEAQAELKKWPSFEDYKENVSYNNLRHIVRPKILLSADPNYENLVAEIYYDDKYFATVWYEGDDFFIDTPKPKMYEPAIIHTMPLDKLLILLEEAKRHLKEEWQSPEQKL